MMFDGMLARSCARFSRIFDLVRSFGRFFGKVGGNWGNATRFDHV